MTSCRLQVLLMGWMCTSHCADDQFQYDQWCPCEFRLQKWNVWKPWLFCRVTAFFLIKLSLLSLETGLCWFEFQKTTFDCTMLIFISKEVYWNCKNKLNYANKCEKFKPKYIEKKYSIMLTQTKKLLNCKHKSILLPQIKIPRTKKLIFIYKFLKRSRKRFEVSCIAWCCLSNLSSSLAASSSRHSSTDLSFCGEGGDRQRWRTQHPPHGCPTQTQRPRHPPLCPGSGQPQWMLSHCQRPQHPHMQSPSGWEDLQLASHRWPHAWLQNMAMWLLWPLSCRSLSQ